MATYHSYKPRKCILVQSDMVNLHRGKLKDEFSKFGMVTKIFIHQEHSYAKVYLDNVEGLTKACSELNGVNGWNLKPFRDGEEVINRNENSNTQHTYYQNDQSCTQRVCSSLPKMNQEDTYVDIHGRDIEVVQDDNNKLYVSLDDVKSSGFYIFSKQDYEDCSFPKNMELDQLRQFLLNQGKNYMLTFKKNFTERDILDVFQRVEEALINPSKSTKFEGNRQVQVEQSGNFFISATNNVSPLLNKKVNEPNINSTVSKGSARVPNNIRPSASYFRSQPRRTQQNKGFQDKRNDTNYHNKNCFNNYTRRPKQMDNTLSDDQTSSNIVDEEKWDDTTAEQSTKLANVKLKPEAETQRMIINSSTNKFPAGPEKANQRQNDPKTKVVPPVSKNVEITQDKNIQDNLTSADLNRTKQKTSAAQPTSAKSQTNAAVVKSEEDVLVKYADLACVKFSMGFEECVCYSCTGETVSLVPMTEEVIKQLEKVETFVPKDTEPYLVDLMEVCVAKFNDVWCRGLVTDLKDDPNMREIFFFDYGNTEDVHVNLIRRFSPDLKSIPILSVTARFEGIPDKQSVYDRIKQLMPDQTFTLVNVVKANADALEYTIQVPPVYDQLRKEGLI